MNHLKTKLEKHTLWITLNRPESSNAFSIEMIHDLVNTLDAAEINNAVRCIVITGEGKHFCAGGDVKDMKQKKGMFCGEPNELRQRYRQGIQQIPLCFHRNSKPTIAMINGAAIGAGLDLACMCDIRVCSDKAKFGETFVKLALIPGDGGSYFLQRVIGFSKAMEMTLTADIYNARQALEMGLVSSIMNLEDLKPAVEKMAEKICANAPIATQMAKRAMINARSSDLQGHLDLLSAFQGITQRTSDHFEALNSVEKKTQAQFKNF